MKERLQKILSERGIASRRQAEKMLLDGRVSCNGQVCHIGESADPNTDLILVDGRPLPSASNHVYILLHKPKGYVTTLSDEQGRKNVAQLVSDCGVRVYPIGRLDMDSEGLLLFTNDGDFANSLMHPSGGIDKVYTVDVKGYTPDAVGKLCKSIILDGYRIAPPKVQVCGTDGDKAVLQITIHEGRNRQIRRMCARAGLQVKRVVRIREGNLQLGELPVGKWRYLTAEELVSLKSISRNT